MKIHTSPATELTQQGPKLFVGVYWDKWLHFDLVGAGALSGSHQGAWLPSDNSEGMGLFCTLCSPLHFGSILAGKSLGPCTLYL